MSKKLGSAAESEFDHKATGKTKRKAYRESHEKSGQTFRNAQINKHVQSIFTLMFLTLSAVASFGTG